jgi:prepilin-type N-terminal cleavage/methylation domain-containing protein
MGGKPSRQGGFTILELLIATAIFLLICGAIFGLLQISQRNYGNESQMSGTFQESRLAVDQIVRDFNQAGFPSLGMFSETPTSAASYAIGPAAWSPNYPGTPCSIGTGGGGTCTTPGDFDLIVETQPANVIGVQWIRYQLVNGTLYRSVAPKVAGVDPVFATSAAGLMVPFLSNVLNNPTGAQLAEINAAYPAMFPGGVTAVPIFQYTCETGAGTLPCPLAGGANSPSNIEDVDITLIVATPTRDAQTQRLKIVELNGRGHRLNPSN